MAWTQADIDALDNAIKDATLEVVFADGRRHRYRSMDEIIQARNFGVTVLSTSSNGNSGKWKLADFAHKSGYEYIR